MRSVHLLVVALLVCAVSAKVYFQDSFDDKSFGKWVVSTSKGAEAGKWKVEQGKYFDNEKDSYALKTTEDAKFYQISAKLDSTFDNKDKDLVLQFSVKHEQDIDCGGGYVKLLPAPLNQKSFNGDSPYHIMFGPDVCGPSNRKIHSILNYKNENHLIREEVGLIADVYTHVYTFILHPDQTFEILLDGESKRKGSIIDEWDLLPPKKIKDPHKEKPADWVDEAEMDDPTDAKPTGWDDIPDTIPDPDAEMPDDWDEELDGQWEAPHIDNPAYKGAWKPKRIPNPAYQGAWVHPMIDNPDYKDDKEIYHYVSDYIGIEIWQVKAGSLFDDFIVTDSVAEAEKLRAKGIASRDAEKKKKEAEEAAARAEADKAKTAEDDDEDEEEEEEADDHAHDEL